MCTSYVLTIHQVIRSHKQLNFNRSKYQAILRLDMKHRQPIEILNLYTQFFETEHRAHRLQKQ